METENIMRLVVTIGTLLLGAFNLKLSRDSWEKSKFASVVFFIIGIIFFAFYIAISAKMAGM